MADTSVNLQVKAQNGNANGFTTSSNPNYGYKYTGGNNGNNGAFSFKKNAENPVTRTVDIQLTASNDFVITAVTISYDEGTPATEHDLTAPTSGVDGIWTISDTDVHAESGYYSVTVSDTKNNVTDIRCDPRWTNTN